VDPASAAALVALLAQGGPWAVVVVVLGIVLRAWRSGEFIPKPTHDQIVAATTQRYLDLLDRFNNQQTALEKWREQADAAAKTAEAAQGHHTELLRRAEDIRKQLEDLKDDLREYFGAVRPPNRRPPGREGN